jgi:hypothetical protein
MEKPAFGLAFFSLNFPPIEAGRLAGNANPAASQFKAPHNAARASFGVLFSSERCAAMT